MTRSPLKLLLISILAVGLFIFINKQFFHNRVSFTFTSGLSKNIAASVFNKLSKAKKIITSISAVSDLANKNAELEKKNNELLSELARTEDLESENNFLKRTLKISEELHPELIEASIYAWNSGPDGYAVMLNKGGADGISEGDIIVSDDKVLIGTVLEVAKGFSKVLVITDPKFKVTARVLGSNTSGIANGDLINGMKFNLIIHDDQINEGDMVVSSGNDTFPASLMIGKVKNVSLGESQLFKEVQIEPAMKDIILGRVIVLKK